VTLYAFYFLSFLAVLSALMVVFSRNPIYSVLYLVITFFCVACHYLLLNAQFLAAVHVIVYAGAIMVLFLYVIMLLNLNKDDESQKTNLWRAVATNNTGLVKNLGNLLFNEFLLPFEIVSILLLTALVGAVMLGKTHMKRIQETSTRKNGRGSVASARGISNIKELTK
jgi:NADH-quinone oxidoreductase subunit J